MKKQVLKIRTLNVARLKVEELKPGGVENIVLEEYTSCIDAGFWDNKKPWVLSSPWKNISINS